LRLPSNWPVQVTNPLEGAAAGVAPGRADRAVRAERHQREHLEPGGQGGQHHVLGVPLRREADRGRPDEAVPAVVPQHFGRG
jgi:hypothetical protein